MKSFRNIAVSMGVFTVTSLQGMALELSTASPLKGTYIPMRCRPIEGTAEGVRYRVAIAFRWNPDTHKAEAISLSSIGPNDKAMKQITSSEDENGYRAAYLSVGEHVYRDFSIDITKRPLKVRLSVTSFVQIVTENWGERFAVSCAPAK